MHDFTLVVPTYNRPKQLAALLAYLETSKASFRILILDSSQSESRIANKHFTQSLRLNLQYAEFANEMNPFDKFREGVQRVTTDFCALCADDDLVLPAGVERCLNALRHNPLASVAQGYSFSFVGLPNGDIDLGNILYFTPTIDDPTPLGRVAKLFALYQAATYGNYRTHVLQRIFATLKPMKSLLGRELLGTALAAVEGHVIRVPYLTHGRSMDMSGNYEHWHPLEWLAKDPEGVLAEYLEYRELIAQTVLARPDNNLDAVAVRRVLDVIHLRYLVKHAPDSALGFIAEQKMAGVPFDLYWPRSEIQQPLIAAAHIGSAAAKVDEGPFRGAYSGKWRTYHLHQNFLTPQGGEAPKPEAVRDLLSALDDYTLDLQPAPTVSVLLCNYNDARYLPDSLTAICNQTRAPDEVIVLDDGSSDNSLEIIEDFARRFPFVRILKNESNRGLLYSINRALHAARSNFVVWAAADDRLMPNFIERNVQCLRQFPLAQLVISRLAVFKDGSDEVNAFSEKNNGIAFDYGEQPNFRSPKLLQQRLQQSHIWISSNTAVASRHALIQAGGFDPDLRWHADYFGFLVVAFRHGLCCIPETLALIRQRAQTYSSTGMANSREQRATLGHLADKLTTRGWRDIGLAVLRCPAVLSPFGGQMLTALQRRPRRWPFAVTYGLWWARHQLGRRRGILAHIGRRSTDLALRAALVVVDKVAGFERWVRPR